MSFTEEFGGEFPINLETTTEILGRFHRTLMDRRSVDWDALSEKDYDDETREQARRDWAARATAEYYSTSQFAQLVHRLCKIGAPLELIGASTRLVTDECRHAELCARMADALGGREGFELDTSQLSFHEKTDDLPLTVYRTILQLCCFGETISVPVLQAMHVVANDPVASEVSEIIATDEGYHMNFGWEALEWMTPELDDSQLEMVEDELPNMFAGFEKVCAGGPEALEDLAGTELVVEEAEEPNLGTLSDQQYAASFYQCVQDEIIPRLEELGYDSREAWRRRLASG